jgi:hypothetical protein
LVGSEQHKISGPRRLAKFKVILVLTAPMDCMPQKVVLGGDFAFEVKQMPHLVKYIFLDGGSLLFYCLLGTGQRIGGSRARPLATPH